MAFLKLFDGTSEIECVVFPKTYLQVKQDLNKEEVVVITGKIDKREEEFSMLVDTLDIFDPDNMEPAARSVIESMDIPEVLVEIPRETAQSILQEVNLTLRKYPGASPIYVLIPSGETYEQSSTQQEQVPASYKKISLKFTVDPVSELVKNIEDILGPGTVRLN